MIALSGVVRVLATRPFCALFRRETAAVKVQRLIIYIVHHFSERVLPTILVRRVRVTHRIIYGLTCVEHVFYNLIGLLLRAFEAVLWF